MDRLFYNVWNIIWKLRDKYIGGVGSMIMNKRLGLLLGVLLVVGVVGVGGVIGDDSSDENKKVNDLVDSIENPSEDKSSRDIFMESVVKATQSIVTSGGETENFQLMGNPTPEILQKVWGQLTPETRMRIWKDSEMGPLDMNELNKINEETKLLRILTPKQKEEFLKQVTKENNGREIPITGLADVESKNIEYKNGQLIIKDGNGGEHIIPLSYLPEDVKEISYQEITGSEGGESDFIGVVYEGKDKNRAFLSEGYIQKSIGKYSKDLWEVGGLKNPYDFNPQINFRSSKGAVVEYGIVPGSRDGEGTKKRFHMWAGEDNNKPVKIMMGNIVAFPHPEGEGDKNGAYGSFSINEEDVFGLRGIMEVGEELMGTRISMYDTDKGVVSFKGEYEGKEKDDYIIFNQLRLDGKGTIVAASSGEDLENKAEQLVSGNAGGLVNFRIGELLDRQINIKYTGTGEFQIRSEPDEGKFGYANTLYYLEGETFVERDDVATQTDEAGERRVVQTTDEEIPDTTSISLNERVELPPAPGDPETCVGCGEGRRGVLGRILGM